MPFIVRHLLFAIRYSLDAVGAVCTAHVSGAAGAVHAAGAVGAAGAIGAVSAAGAVWCSLFAPRCSIFAP